MSMESNRLIGQLTGLALAAALAVGNLVGWHLWHRPVLAPDAAGPIAGLAYNAFGRWDSPIEGRYPSNASIDADLAMLSSLTRRIRTYSSAEFPELPGIAARHGLKVTAGVWLDGQPLRDRREIEAVKEAVRYHRNIERVIVGNEVLLHGALGIDEMIAHLRELRRTLRVPVSTAEPWHVWLRFPELAKNVDYITAHLLPYWEGVPSEVGVDYALERYEQLKARFPGKHVVIGEIGWPSRGDRWTFGGGTATASPTEQARFMREFLARVKGKPVDYFVMEAIDQPWKANNEGRVGAYWGLFHADRTPKFELQGPVLPDPNWEIKAFLASLLGFVAAAWFATRFTRMRTASRVAFALVLQAVASFLVWLLAVPFDHYMRSADWIGLAVLLPTLMLMVTIALTTCFEFVEMFWRGNLKREFGPRAMVAGAPEPKVSIHLACCNEPPAMVIATLESLARLNWRNYEVLVVDNNTVDPAKWEPVRDWVERSGDPRFRFFHLPRWPGFKAGALNFALTQTAPDAQVIGVVDADYIVRPQWLASTIAHFDDPRVAVVQTPQAHRGWGRQVFRRMMNWEYDGFFRIGMHHRNERDAIIQHGTMTLIRAQSLLEHGRWSEWTICEDAELGLRMMKAGLRTVYVDRVMGEGLTPDDFAQFKKQRRRWAQGAMQILKAHWRSLVRRGPLTPAQRYHFVTGWLPWVGDALHLVFTFGAMAWTIGLLAAPKQFHYPILMYLVPLVVFFGMRTVIGPLLYWRRVRCSPGETLGAALAGMGLSHAIALGVIAGLAQRDSVFEITGKGSAARRAATGLGAAREEGLLLAGLLLCIVSVGLTRQVNHMESALWMTVLALQASPYAAAVLCAWLSTRPERPEPGVAPLPAVTPTTAILPARPAAATESTARPPVAMPGPVGPGWRTVPLQRTALPMAGSRDRTAGVGPR
jgi:exo-beta-1,3-glucanase (GH17 family)/cellulose synthase/poly-beta-1,6-N-acetylglucosamine synthase-like glycosyltransferase